jgi:hypothetical protein
LWAAAADKALTVDLGEGAGGNYERVVLRIAPQPAHSGDDTLGNDTLRVSFGVDDRDADECERSAVARGWP